MGSASISRRALRFTRTGRERVSLGLRGLAWALVPLLAATLPASAVEPPFDSNEPGVLEPVTTALTGHEVRIPNTDQSIDGVEQSMIHGGVAVRDAAGATSLLGHPITRVASPNDDLRLALAELAEASRFGDPLGMQEAARELKAIVLGTTVGRIYDGFSMLNFNRWKHPEIGPEHFPADALPGEYKMKVARPTGETFVSSIDDQEHAIWEIDINMLYYDGQIDADTFLVRFPIEAHEQDTVRINYRIYSLVVEDFSPTLVMLDRRMALDTVNFPFKGLDAVWVAMEPGQVVELSIDYPPIRQLRGVYTWGWRVHPPRIQFLQPVYEIRNAHTGEVELDPQSASYAYRNREDLTLDAIGPAAPELKAYEVAEAVLAGAVPTTVYRWLTEAGQGPRGTWTEWANLLKNQRQLPPEAWEQITAEEGLEPGDYGKYSMISVFLNNEMYGEGPFLNEVAGWDQGDFFDVKLINLDRHTHYFRNVDFGTRLHDDILRCCGGGLTSFEVMNFKPSYGAPKVAEMQWRAGWGFRPHHDVIQQQDVFPRSSDRLRLRPYTDGDGDIWFGYQYSEASRQGDFRFNPPPFIITDHDHPAPFPLMDADGQSGLVLGQFTEGYGVAQMCPGDPYPGFCQSDLSAFNPFGVKNWPAPNDPSVPKTELRFPPFLRNPAQGTAGAGDIIPPTGAWETFLFLNPANGTLFLDPDDPSAGYWSDLTFAHGATVYSGESLDAHIELPRASGQVFYQFDDLFHDNSIFSPHPLFEGPTVPDEVVRARAFIRRFLRIRGTLGPSVDGSRSDWVTLYDGPAGESGCTGKAVAVSPVRERDGFFVFRCGADQCSTPLAEKAYRPVGGKLCVESLAGAFREVVVRGN